MTRQRLYNPAQLTPDELKASFVARKDTLGEMLRLIREQTPGHPCQHMMLIGPRGMGKTTLGLRLLHEILETPDLAADWQPVAFHEESYGIGDLADFWLATLRHLTRATDDPRWADRAKALPNDEKDTDRQAAYALASLMDFCQTSGKRLLLFVENLDTVLEQLSDERQVHALRASLIERTNILLIGSANTVFEAIRSHGEPLYEFFRLFILKGLGSEETRRILAALADAEDKPGVMEALDHDHGRLETIRRLTGGNPRLLVLACRLLIDSPLSSAFEDLERLIDEQTPYFKARIEELPVQARKVFHCLADGWKPMQSKDVAEAAKLSSSHASAQLRQLMEKGYAREVTLPNAKRTLYEVSDRFYNIYYLLRFSRAARDRLERLVAFLHDLFGATAMQTMYAAALETLRTQGSPPGEQFSPRSQMFDLLGILASYVARDADYKGRGDWLRKALELAENAMGSSAPLAGEIRETFATYHPVTSDRFAELMNRGNVLFKADRFEDAATFYRAATEERPNDAGAWFSLGVTLISAERFEAAISSFDEVMRHTDADVSLELWILANSALMGKCMSLWHLEQHEAVVATLQDHPMNVTPLDEAPLRYVAASLLDNKGNALKELDRLDEATVTWDHIVEYVHTDDPVYLRRKAGQSLSEKASALERLDRLHEASAACERIADYVHVDDPADVRLPAVAALLFTRTTILLRLGRREDLAAANLSASDYVGPDDPPDMRQPAVTILANTADLLNFLAEYGEAEEICKRAVTIEPAHDESWRVLANAILGQDDTARLVEAEDCAKRAVELAPHESFAAHTLSNVLARRGNWTEALDALQRALQIGGDDPQNQDRPAVTASLIRATACGHGLRVKQIMEDFGLVESMEPLWHAVRAELGEELEPLPAEVMDAVNDIRREFHNKPDTLSGVM